MGDTIPNRGGAIDHQAVVHNTPISPCRALNTWHWERIALIILFSLGLLLRIGRLQEIAQHPEWIVPDQDQVDMAFFYNYGQDLAAKCRDFLGIPKPEPNPLPPSPVNWTQDPRKAYTRPPAYSFFLACCFLLSGNRLLAPLVIQNLLGLLNALLAWRLARHVGGRIPSLLTAAFTLFYWVLLVYEGVYHALTLMTFLALLFINTLQYWSTRPSLARAATVGATMTLNMLATPSSALFAPVAALWMLFWLRATCPTWKATLLPAFRHVMITTISAAVLVSPVTWSNWRATGLISLVSQGAGSMLLIGNHDGADGYYHDPQKALIGIDDTGNPDLNSRLIFEKTGLYIPPHRMSVESGKFALRWIRQHPERFLALTLKRAVIYWQPKEISHNVQEYCLKKMSRILRWLPGGFPEILGALGVAAVMGLWSCRRADPWTRLRWMLPFLYSLVFYLPFTVFYFAGHYRVPILPFLAMMGAGGVCAALDHLRTRPMLAITAFSCGIVLWVSTRMIPVDYEDDWERWFYYKPDATRRLKGEEALNVLENETIAAGLAHSSAACLFLASRANERKDYAAAATWCRTGLEQKSCAPEQKTRLLELLVGSLNAAGTDPATLDATVAELLVHDPQNFLARMYRANRAIQAAECETAIQELQIALEANPNNGNAWFLLGNCQMAMGFPQQAEEAYRKGMENDPADPWPAMGLAGVLETQGRLDEARQAAEEALRRDPSIQAARDMLQKLNPAQP